MNKSNQKPTKHNSIETTVLVPAASSCGLGCLTVSVLGFVALKLGFCFIWPHANISWTLVIFCSVLLTAILFRARKKSPPWILFLVEILVISVLGVTFSTWQAPKRIFKICYLDPIPPSVVIHRSHHFTAGPDLSSWIHFSAPPNVMLSIIQTNNLTEVTTKQLQREYRTPGFISGVPDWWTTNTLTSPILYRCEHTGNSGVYQPWTIGMWVNSKTNEALGYVY